MVYITKQVHFCAAHKLYNPKWSDEENDAVFGLCANKNWHGHNFDLFVTIKGEPDPNTGFVMNFKDLKKTVKDEVLELVDHKNLNIDSTLTKEQQNKLILEKLTELEAISEPIPVIYENILLSRIYYGDSELIKRLQYYP